MEPLVSIIIPVYNRSITIITALESIKAQTYKRWEVVVVDDGSKDNTAQIVEELSRQDARIKFISHDANKGGQAARNTGIKIAKGEWIAFLDSDDQWLPESLELRLKIAERKNVPVVHSQAYILHPGKPMEIYYLPNWQGWIYKNALSKEGPMFQGLLVKKECLERINYLDEKVVAYQEWDTAIRLAKYYQFGFEERPTFIYDYTTPNAISRNSIRNAKGYSYIFHKHFKDILFYAGPGTIGYHFEVIAKWYKDGGNINDANRYKLKALVWKCLSPTIVLQKIRNVMARRK